MESQPQNPEWNNPENFHPCNLALVYGLAKTMITESTIIRLYTVGMK